MRRTDPRGVEIIMPNGIFSALLFAGVLYISFSATLFFTQSRIVYYPERKIITTPAAIDLPYKNIHFTAADDTRLTDWFIPAGQK